MCAEGRVTVLYGHLFKPLGFACFLEVFLLMEELYSGCKISSEACYYKDRIFALEEKQEEGLCLVHGWNIFFPFEWFIPLFLKSEGLALKLKHNQQR